MLGLGLRLFSLQDRLRYLDSLYGGPGGLQKFCRETDEWIERKADGWRDWYAHGDEAV